MVLLGRGPGALPELPVQGTAQLGLHTSVSITHTRRLDTCPVRAISIAALNAFLGITEPPNWPTIDQSTTHCPTSSLICAPSRIFPSLFPPEKMPSQPGR